MKYYFIGLLGVLGGSFACDSDHRSSSALELSHRDSLHQALTSIMALPEDTFGTPAYEILSEEETDTYTLTTLSYEVQPGDLAPAYLLRPKDVAPPYPVMICLQGHAPGMYISVGDARTERDAQLIAGGRDIALQAVANGWAALTIEQRGFGEQAEEGVVCNDLALRELMRGRPLLGQRVFDVMRGIDFIETQDDLNADLVGSMGNSAGGTVSYFAACADPRIKLAVVSCSFCTYERSWLKYPHCACGYLPGLLEVADMPELAELIAPRNLLIVAGEEDYIADIEGVRDGFSTAQEFYGQYNARENVSLLVGDGGHQFYPELAWPKINEFKNTYAKHDTKAAFPSTIN